MAGHAHVLNNAQLERLLQDVLRNSRRPAVDRVVYLLSYKAGLRVQEIAGLQWSKNILDPDGNIRRELFVIEEKGKRINEHHPIVLVTKDIGKYGAERSICMHPMLYEAVEVLRAENLPGPWVIPSARRGAGQTVKSRAHALKVRINRFYRRLGYVECSTHSGRRTFITTRARLANFAGCSLRDVQILAGHRQLNTTQGYIEITPNQARLVAMD